LVNAKKGFDRAMHTPRIIALGEENSHTSNFFEVIVKLHMIQTCIDAVQCQ
jgi:hypothetical protein